MKGKISTFPIFVTAVAECWMNDGNFNRWRRNINDENSNESEISFNFLANFLLMWEIIACEESEIYSNLSTFSRGMAIKCYCSIFYIR